MSTNKDFNFASLSPEQLENLLGAEDHINQGLEEPVYLIAYKKS